MAEQKVVVPLSQQAQRSCHALHGEKKIEYTGLLNGQ